MKRGILLMVAVAVATGCLAYTTSVGMDLTHEETVTMDGSSASFGWSGTAGQSLGIGSAATVVTIPDAGGAGPVNVGAASITLEFGSRWILDGTNYPGPYTVGTRFVLARCGAFSGSVRGVRFRNFDLPANRELQLFVNSTSLYYEVVSQTPASGPNIIIINCDDMAYGEFFGFDGANVLSPTLDSLADSGIRFTQAHVSATVCGPSRYSLLTGRYPSRNTSAYLESVYPPGTLDRFGVSDSMLETDGESLGFWLQRAGYRTGFVGKSHLINHELDQTNNWASMGLITYSPTDDPKTNAVVNGAMKHNHRAHCQYMKDFGFDYVNSFYNSNTLELRNTYLDQHNMEWITEGALQFIDENHSQRFLLVMNPTVNHGPTRNDLTKSLLTDAGYTSAGYLPDEDYSFMPSRQSIINEVTAAGKVLKTARQTWLDYSIAAVLNKLDEYGVKNDTLIIFTADHGFDTYLTSPTYMAKSSLYDLALHVPLVMCWPAGIASPGRTYNELVQQVDFVPTLLELAGATNLPTREIDGVSLVPVFNGDNSPVRNEIFSEIGYARCVRSKDWKYIAVRYTPDVYSKIDAGYLWTNVINTVTYINPRPYYINNASLGQQSANSFTNYFDDDQLFNLTADPLERTNRLSSYPDKVYDFKKRLATYLGDFAGRPFRQFSDGSAEFNPAPSAPPGNPGDLQITFPDANTASLTWSDTVNNELGYIVEQSVYGAPFEIIYESGINTTSAVVTLSASISNTVLRVSAYNAASTGHGGGNEKPAGLVDRTDEAGAIVTSQHTNSLAGFGPDRLFDNDANTKFLITNSSGWVQHQFGGGKKYTVVWYSVTSAMDAPPGAPVNLVLNGSFESGGTSPDNWTLTSPDASRSTDTASDGSASLKLSRTTSGVNLTATYQEIPVEIGKTYTIGVWVNSAGITGGLLVFDTNDKYDGAPDNCEIQFSTSNGGWTEYTRSFTATNTPLRLRCFGNAAFTGTVYIDGVSLTDAAGGPGDADAADPAGWILSGSNDGAGWTPIDSRGGIAFSSRGQTQEFSALGNTNAYEVYRLALTNNGGTSLQLAEVELFSAGGEYGTPYDLIWSTVIVGDPGTGPLEDYDDDGRSNFYEYALNGNPEDGLDTGTAPVFARVGDIFEYSHLRRNDDTGLTYRVEAATNLISGVWTNIGIISAVTNVTGGAYDVVTNSISAAEPRLYIRLKITGSGF